MEVIKCAGVESLALPLAFCASLLTHVATSNMSTSLGEIGW